MPAHSGHAEGVRAPVSESFGGPLTARLVPGHEPAGTVAAVGAGVRRWSAGDRVTVPFVNACGACAQVVTSF